MDGADRLPVVPPTGPDCGEPVGADAAPDAPVDGDDVVGAALVLGPLATLLVFPDLFWLGVGVTGSPQLISSTIQHIPAAVRTIRWGNRRIMGCSAEAVFRQSHTAGGGHYTRWGPLVHSDRTSHDTKAANRCVTPGKRLW